MTYKYAFEKLDVWHDAKNLTLIIYRQTKLLPEEEKFGLIAQMRRCAISICSNLSEGSSRRTPKDQAHFYTMGYSSLMELLNQCIISYDLTFLNEEAYTKNRTEVENMQSYQ